MNEQLENEAWRLTRLLKAKRFVSARNERIFTRALRRWYRRFMILGR